MMTRRHVDHQYGAAVPGAAPPFHYVSPARTGQARPLAPGGGLVGGGAVALNTAGWVGIRRAATGYGWLGMDPSDPQTWPRPFVPSSGMISYLNFGARV